MKPSFVTPLLFLFATSLYAQTGSINNTLGSGGTFTVKNSSSDPLVVVDEATGQLTADRIKVEGVPSFFATHVAEDSLSSPHVLATWSESASTGAHDNSANFNPSTGEFAAPRDGLYFFSAHIELYSAGNTGATLYVRIDGTVTGLSEYTPTSYSGSSAILDVAGVLKLTSGQTVTLLINAPGATAVFSAETGYFSGYLISDF